MSGLAAARPVPATIGLVFGGLWGLIGALAAPAVWRLPMAVASGIVSLGLVVRLWCRAPGADRATRGLFGRRAYLIAVALEILAIYAASALLPRLGLQGYFIQAVGVIVGLHFIGLWQATGSRRFLGIAGGMCVVSAAAAIFPYEWQGWGLRDAITGLGNAIVLWTGASRAGRS